MFGSPDAMGVGGPRPELNITIAEQWQGPAARRLTWRSKARSITGRTSRAHGIRLWKAALSLSSEPHGKSRDLPLSVAPAVPGQLLRPRFLRLLFTPVGTFTAGTIASALVTFVRDDQFNKYAAKAYQVA